MDDSRDDDPTPRERGRARLQTAEDRDLASDARRRRQARSHPLGVPLLPRSDPEDFAPDQETTDPLALLPSVPDERVVAAVRRAGRDTEQPVRYLELAQLLTIVKEQIRKERHKAQEDSERRQAEEMRELLDRPPREVHYRLVKEVEDGREDLRALRAELTDQGKSMALARKLIAAALIAGLGALGTVAKGLYERGGRETAIDLRLERCEKDIEHLERVNERERDTRDRDRRDREPAVFPPLPTTKGQTP